MELSETAGYSGRQGVGGTGTYANARGFVEIRHVGPENEAQDTSNDEFHLVP